ncbi:MAG: tetratricopeptide repeat protein [Deltaproteobacteria bacterium]|nr:tetratricopeptide repeat protein [Deltaproteobacteria bacterium]
MRSSEQKIHLPYLLSYLWQGSFSGTLHLMEGGVKRSILFHHGNPVHVRSQLQEETLGRILLDEKRIDEEQYARMLDIMVQTHRPAGEILISIGALTPQDVFNALEYQTYLKLTACFNMPEFGFDIEQGSVPPQMIIIKPRISEVILTGIGTHYGLDRLLTEFPVDEETIFVSRRGPDLQLGPWEMKLLRKIGTGLALCKLMSPSVDLQKLLCVLYTMHALGRVIASGISLPSSDDLVAPELLVQPQAPLEVAPPPEAPADTVEEEDYNPPTLASISAGVIDPALARAILGLPREDHFSLLGVSRNARAHEIRAAYDQIVSKFGLDQIDRRYATEKERELAQRLLDHATLALRELSEPQSREAYVDFLRTHEPSDKREPPARILADAEAHKGQMALRAKRYDEARERFQAAIRLYSFEPDYFFQLGRLAYLEAMDETPAEQPLPESVRDAFNKTLAVNPRNDRAWVYLGYISKRNGDFRRAVKEFQSALECNRQNRIAQGEIRLLEKRLPREST